MAKARETKEQFFRRQSKNIRCNCGGPQYGTGHSPDCDLMISNSIVEDLWQDELYQRRLQDIEASYRKGNLTPEEYNEACYKAACP